MNKILFTGFNGDKNTSKLVLDYLSKNTKYDCMYLENDFELSVSKFIKKIKSDKYDFIVSFGQKPVIKSLYFEKYGKNRTNKLETNYDFTRLKCFSQKWIKTKTSENAGNYLCNNLYYNGLKYIYENKLKAKMIFIHIPSFNNCVVECISEIIINYIKENKGL